MAHPLETKVATMCESEIISILRQRIRQTGKQFRYNNDNSESIFHPKQGFAYGYDIAQVERALDEFEQAIGTDLWQAPELEVVG